VGDEMRGREGKGIKRRERGKEGGEESNEARGRKEGGGQRTRIRYWG